MLNSSFKIPSHVYKLVINEGYRPLVTYVMIMLSARKIMSSYIHFACTAHFTGDDDLIYWSAIAFVYVYH